MSVAGYVNSYFLTYHNQQATYIYAFIYAKLEWIEKYLNFSPAWRTDSVCLYLLYNKYSLISSLMSMFSLVSEGGGSELSLSALNTSALIRAFTWPKTPRVSKVSFTTAKWNKNTDSIYVRTKNWV